MSLCGHEAGRGSRPPPLCGHKAERGCCGPGHEAGRTWGYSQASLGTRPKEGGVYVALRARGRKRISPPLLRARGRERVLRSHRGHDAGRARDTAKRPRARGREGDVDVPLRARGRERVSPSPYRQEAGRGLCRPPAGTRPGECDIQVPLTDDPREVSFTRAQRRCGHYAPAEPSSRAISPGSFMTGQQKFNAPIDAKPPPPFETAGLSVAGQASPSARAECRSDRWAIGAKKNCFRHF
jgi:hypothetical protein